MTILNTGEVGVGNFTPIYKFDVEAGDINLHTITNGYRIVGGGGSTSDYVLWHNGNLQDIFVGVGAGNNFMMHHAHVCVGNLSGTRITFGDSLTFVGDESGTTNDTGSYNTAVGCRALFSNRSASNNVAIGNNALHSLVMCTDDGGGHETENPAVGVDALYYNMAYGGCALGFGAGKYNVHGCSLIAIGEEAVYLRNIMPGLQGGLHFS